MKDLLALTVAVVAGLQVAWADSFFKNVKPVQPQQAVDPSVFDGPASGILDAIAKPHIVGGKEAVPHSHPYQVALKIITDTEEAFCGGSLISDTWVLTAAHCTDKATSLTAVVGAHNISVNEPTARRVKVDKVIIHPNYKAWWLENDIALLKLESRVFIDGRNVDTIRLPTPSQKDELFHRVNVTMTGWGKDGDRSLNQLYPVLREVDSYVIANWYCSLRFYFLFVRETNICVSGWWLKPFGTCTSDGGGPMFVVEADGQKTLIGVTSFTSSIGCEKTWPPIFARVTSYLDWIHKETGIPARF